MRKRLLLIIMTAMLFAALCPLLAFADEAEYTPAVYATWWSVLPPLIAIALALITKEVYSSLFIGVVIGGFIYAGGNPGIALSHVFKDGIVASLADPWNVGILVFLVILGVIVALLNRTGGSRAFGRWAAAHIKTKKGASFATIILGILIFVDDYFNCLTVGSVMTPLAEEKGINKTKMAYLIDSTAAPVCIIAPISSWAAAVTGFVEGTNGFTLFLQAIPFNFYALLTILMMFVIVGLDFDYGTMKKAAQNMLKEEAANIQKSDLDTSVASGRREGKVIDLILPVIILIIACVIGMIYTGGFFSGETFVNAFANSDASVGLVIGSVAAIIISLIYYIASGVITVSATIKCFPEGFKAMIAPILILTLAWSLKAMTDSVGIADFVAALTKSGSENMVGFLPALVFAIGCVLAFASGTSWGTFGILIPIVVAVFQQTNPELMIIAISACMAGAVCGDHCSPISDTTIMASAGAKCNHIAHVSTQIPYAVTVAIVSFITYIISGYLCVLAGFKVALFASLPIGIVLILGTLLVIRAISGKNSYEAA